MPRKPRLFVPGCFYHAMARGIEGRNIFNDDEDRTIFLGLFSAGLKKHGFACYAWTLMGNHYHFLLQCGDRPLADLMRPLNSRYAQHHGRKYGRRGYLFQDRYKSVATQDQQYVREIVRYVHANPLRAGICRSFGELSRFRWSGHAVLLGKRVCDFMDPWVVLRRFGETKEKAMQEYRKFMANGIGAIDDDLVKTIRLSNEGRAHTHNPGCWVIGDAEFVKQAMASDKANRIRLARYRIEGVTLSSLAKRFAKAADITEGELQRRSRGTKWRKVFAFLSRREYGFSIAEIGRYLGVSGPAVSIAADHGAALVKSEASLGKLIN